MSGDWCAVWVAYGARWLAEAAQSIETFRAHHPDVLTIVISGISLQGTADVGLVMQRGALSDEQASRQAKINLLSRTPGPYVLYLDADTRVTGRLDGYIEPLRAGYEMVITPSINQGVDLLRHIAHDERLATLTDIGHGVVQWQAGAFAVRDTEATRALFACWRDEWLRWRGQDQGALLRALARCPVKLWVLGRDWNGGAMVAHRSASG